MLLFYSLRSRLLRPVFLTLLSAVVVQRVQVVLTEAERSAEAVTATAASGRELGNWPNGSTLASASSGRDPAWGLCPANAYEPRR